MTLSSGSRFGDYEIAAPLGLGAMGEVYRARDTRLGRDVALKVLPERFRLDAQRLARFTREAHVLAQLNHPNIATLHGVVDVLGAQALVLELVEGRTLAERIAAGPMAVDEALAAALQIAAALEAAHEHGVVHRDLKPANVKLRPDGAVKLLDFGLAKVVDPTAEGAGSAVATITVLDIAPGGALGTPAYMSPEQTRGRAADARSDVWAFGCVLYEMLTGRRAFAGETVSDSIAAILDREPDWSALPAECPALLRRLLRHCLAKDRNERLRHIGDARIDLREAMSPVADAAGVTGTASARPAHSWRSPWLIAGAAAATAVASIAFAVLREPNPSTPLVTRFAITPEDGFVVRDYVRSIAISRDGRSLAYVSTGASLVVRSLDRLETTRLARLGSEVANPSFSPDGRSIAFLVGSALKTVPAAGGPVTTVADVGEDTERGIAWVADDTIVVAGTRGLVLVSPRGGEPELLAAPDAARGEKVFITPEALPGGRVVIFAVRPLRPESGIVIAAFDLATRTRTDLLNGGSQPRYSPTGHLVYARTTGAIDAVPFDAEQLAVSGEPRTVVTNVMVNPNGSANFVLAENGTLVYVPGTASRPQLAWVTRDGREEPLPVPPLEATYPRLSPDGQWLALDVRQPDSDIWISDLEGGRLTPITRDPAENALPTWHKDGWLAFGDARNGPMNIYRQPIDASAPLERLTESPRRQVPVAFTPDGSRLLFMESQPEGDWDILSLTLAEPRRIEPLLHSAYSEQTPVFSPDGRLIAYSSDESGRFEVYVRPFPNVDGGRWQVSRGGGSKPLWSRDGREIFYVGTDRALMAAEVALEPEFVPGKVTKVFDATPYTAPESGTGGRPYDLSLDGQRFLMLRRINGGDDPLVEARMVVVVNWFEELRTAAPGR